MNVLFVASECAPFIKTGGLADVIGAVPKLLQENGVSVRILIPCYPALDPVRVSGSVVEKLDEFFGGPAELVSVSAKGLELLLLVAPHLYDRPGSPYLTERQTDWPDNHLRFAALSWMGAQLGIKGVTGWQPDIIHAHDWQAGLVSAYLKQTSANTPRVMFTIHNIAFQGLFTKDAMVNLKLNNELFTADGVEFYDQLGFLKGGIKLADFVTTVSPSYAHELLTAEFGMGLEGLLQSRQSVFYGILNGIDQTVWDPQNDPHIAQQYDAINVNEKYLNHAAVRKRFGLTESADGPLFCVVSRLTHQKGLDLLLQCLPVIKECGAQLVLLGSGDASMESAFVAAAQQYRGSVGVLIGYDEPLSHLIQAGSDAILIPSRFEPCGLTQLYGLRYGTLPIVARTGGLADTVIDANYAAIMSNCATGLQFTPNSRASLERAIRQTCQLFQDQRTWMKIVSNAMQQNVGWELSAESYLALYQKLTGDQPDNVSVW